VNIPAFCTLAGRDVETVVQAGTPVIIVWGWESKTDQQLQDFLDNNLTTIRLDGKIVEGKLNPEVKVNKRSGNPEVAWSYEAGILAEGRHTITYDVNFKKMIDDGTTTYGPGGKIESSHDECAVTVQPPIGKTAAPETPANPSTSATVPDDDFSGNALDLTKWQPSAYGGASIKVDERAILSASSSQASSSAMIASTWTLPGDFDVQIDFDIREGWKSPESGHLDGAAFGVKIGGVDYHATRLRSADEDVIFAWSSDGSLSKRTEMDMKQTFGSMKIVRDGPLLTFLYDIGGGWTELANIKVSETDAQVYFMNGSVDALTGFNTYFDNFKINSGATDKNPRSDQPYFDTKNLPGKVVVPLTEMAPAYPWLPLDDKARPVVYYFYFNLRKPPFDNTMVRQAFSAAIDREALVRTAKDFGIRDVKPATTFTPPETLGRELYNTIGIPFDPIRAKELIASAGYPDGKGFPDITLLTGVSVKDPPEFHEKIAAAVAEMWHKNLGINVVVEVEDFETYRQQIESNPPEVFKAVLLPLENDPHNFMMSFQTNHKNNFGGFSSDEYNRLVAEASKSNDASFRQAEYVELERLLTEVEAVVIPVYHALYP
jgi:hypothetical protein